MNRIKMSGLMRSQSQVSVAPERILLLSSRSHATKDERYRRNTKSLNKDHIYDASKDKYLRAVKMASKAQQEQVDRPESIQEMEVDEEEMLSEAGPPENQQISTLPTDSVPFFITNDFQEELVKSPRAVVKPVEIKIPALKKCLSSYEVTLKNTSARQSPAFSRRRARQPATKASAPKMIKMWRLPH